jgi:histidine decarboxylase
MGSRNGHASVYLWYAIQKKGMSGLRKDTIECLQKARKLSSLLQENGIDTYLGPLSCTVVFERPSEHDFVRKWQLACEGDIAHVVVMPSTSVQTLKKFVDELVISKSGRGRQI